MNRFFQEEHGAFAEGGFEAEYYVPGAVYDPSSVFPVYAAGYGPLGTHVSSELPTDERAEFTALLEQPDGASATALGNLTPAAECRIPLRSGAAPFSCRTPRYSAEKRDAVAEQCRVALDAGVIERADHCQHVGVALPGTMRQEEEPRRFCLVAHVHGLPRTQQEHCTGPISDVDV